MRKLAAIFAPADNSRTDARGGIAATDRGSGRRFGGGREKAFGSRTALHSRAKDFGAALLFGAIGRNERELFGAATQGAYDIRIQCGAGVSDHRRHSRRYSNQ